MKIFRIHSLLSLLLAVPGYISVAQPGGNIPVSDSPSTAVQAPYPGLVNMANPGKYNYIQSITPDQPMQSLPASGYQYRQQRDYFDGLGRPLQSIQRRAHADGNDIIQVHVYDSLGRERYQYLPYANQPFANQVPGTIQLHVNTMMRNFYDLSGPDEAPYSRTDYEASVLSRPLKQLQPGRAWVGGNRGVRNLFRFNTQGEVMLWNIDRALHAKPYVNGTYSAGELSVTETTDEDGRINQEFKDKDGRLVLQKRYVNNPVPYYAHTGYACTYYVYDDQGRLRFVIPPQGVNNVPLGWDVDPIREFCYSYEYDRRGRLIERKIPGKAVEEFVYDDRSLAATATRSKTTNGPLPFMMAMTGPS
ncbi:DUF6443 domain-containing protein [Taibaiella chishuiensis]|uniref:DUF6443 domain-containing protein n=1 Tax=Taibaiella chishuiensis TaxID=1434707 RepID=A0A2P8CUZ3_9BACT|nr:DUF6443 domain-containing protein [Taibaiella chishuiensis]PSK88791.1 hypothetical protein B0I18_1142 [Taibaiella chishuiensis]